MLVVVVYDIPDNKRRKKLADFLEGYGRRVQYSVFECFISLDKCNRFMKKSKIKLNLKKITSDFIGYLQKQLLVV